MNQQLTIDLVEKHANACKEQLSVENCETNIKFYDQQKGKKIDLKRFNYNISNMKNISVMQEFIKNYSMALLVNHVANKETIAEKGWFTIDISYIHNHITFILSLCIDITDEDISQLTLEYEKMIATSKSNTDLMKIHSKVLEDFEKLNKAGTMIKNIRDIEAVQSENADLKAGFVKKFSYRHQSSKNQYIFPQPITKKKISSLEEGNYHEKIRIALDQNADLKKEVEALEQRINAQNEAKKKLNSNSKTQKLLDAFA